jgi:hypothetical protein
MSDSHNYNSAQARYGVTTWLLSSLSASWCAISLLLISILATAILSPQIVRTWQNRDDLGIMAFTLPNCAMSVFFVMALGFASGRFLVRAQPPMMPRKTGLAQVGTVVLCAVFVVACIYGTFVFVGAFFTQIPQIRPLGALVLLIVWTSSVIGILVYRYRRPLAFLDQPFVLFLRRFSTFSDRAVTALILQQAANRVPVVFLTPTIGRPGDWDPYIVGFAGLKLWHPWRSTPFVVRADDKAWQSAADELIRRAHTIILDTSDTSGALRAEAEMLARSGRWPDTVCLSLLTNSRSDPASGPVPAPARVISYSKSWGRAIPRMAVGILIVLPFVYVLFVLSYAADWLVLPAKFAAVIVTPAYYYSAFVRPSIDSQTRSELRSLFRAVQATSAIEKFPQGIKGWLIPVVIWIVAVPIVNDYLLLELWPIFENGVWENLTTPGTAVYHYLWGPWITYEIAAALLVSGLAVTTLLLLFRKSKKTPVFGMIFAATSALLAIIGNYFGNLIPAVAEQSSDDVSVIIQSVAGAAIVIPYFIFSRRVKATFVN